METADSRPRKTQVSTERKNSSQSRARVSGNRCNISRQYTKAVQNNINVLQGTLYRARRSFFTGSHMLTKAYFWGHSFFAEQHQE